MPFDKEKTDFEIIDGQLNKYLGNEKHVVVPDGVTVVNEKAFENSVDLERIDFPDSVKILVLGWGDKVFANCPHLHTVKLGKNIEYYNLSLPAGTKVLFPQRFEVFYRDMLSAEDTARLLYGLYCRNGGEASYRNFTDLVHVFLSHSSPKVKEKAAAIVFTYLRECLAVIRKIMPKLEGTPRDNAERFLRKYDTSPGLSLGSRDDVERYCRENYNKDSGQKLLWQLKVKEEYLDKIRWRDTMKPAPAVVSRFVFLQYMLTEKVERDENCDRIAEMLVTEDLQNTLEKTYAYLSGYGPREDWGAIFEHRAFMTAYCRFASPDQVRALTEKISRWVARGEKGQSFLTHVLAALALNNTPTALLFLDKLGKLAFAAKIRRIPVDKLRDSLIPDFGFDQDGAIYGESKGKKYRITVLPDLSLQLFDMEKGTNISSLPPKTQIAFPGSTLDFIELTRTIKEIKEQQLALLKHQFVTGATKTVVAWRKTYAENTLLRRLAQSIIWSYSFNREKETFRILDDGALIDVKGHAWFLPEKGAVSVAHPLNLTAAEIAAWSKQLTTEGLYQPFGQLSEQVIPFSSLDVIKNRYAGIILPFGLLKYLEAEGFKIYGNADFGYQADNNVVRLHFDFGIKTALSAAKEDDPVYIRALNVANLTRARAINHSLNILDRLPVLGAIKKDEIDCLIAYIENKNLGLDAYETETFLCVANQYQSFKCTAELLDYKNRHLRFNTIRDDIKL